MVLYSVVCDHEWVAVYDEWSQRTTEWCDKCDEWREPVDDDEEPAAIHQAYVNLVKAIVLGHPLSGEPCPVRQ